MRIAVLGIGLMGFPMARRLCQAGHSVQAWNRSADKAARLLECGATVHPSAAAAASAADVVLTMLENGDVVEHVIFDAGVAAALQHGSTLIDMSSIRPDQARAHAKRLEMHRIHYLDAPVSGGTLGAEQGTLAIMAGGDASVFEQAKDVFSPLGRATLVGPTGSGQLAKLANQMIVGVTIGAVAEALLLCAKGGADMAQVRKAISGGFADSRILQVHGERMVQRNFVPGGRMNIQLKDMRNALATAADIGFSAPITELFEQLYAQGVEHGDAELDQSALFRELARRNGLS